MTRLREALETILANTEEDAIPHIAYDGMTAYQALAKDIADCARAALSLPSGGDEAKESDLGCMADFSPGDPANLKELLASEPSPPADRREIVARIINTKVGSKSDPNFVERRWLTGVDEAADAILAALASGPEGGSALTAASDGEVG